MSSKIKIVFEDSNEALGFTQVPNAVVFSRTLSPTEVRIYAIMRYYASMSGEAFPEVATICADANISKATYARSIKKFVRSTENPNPEVPLVTIIHRPNQTNIYKIHKLTDEIIERLKPTIIMDKKEKEQIKDKYRKKRKTELRESQNETPIENTRESQNETSGGSQNETPIERQRESQNETPSGVSNRDGNNNNNNVVVVVNKKIYIHPEFIRTIKEDWQRRFGEELTDGKFLQLKKACMEGFAEIGFDNYDGDDIASRIAEVIICIDKFNRPFKKSALACAKSALKGNWEWGTDGEYVPHSYQPPKNFSEYNWVEQK